MFLLIWCPGNAPSIGVGRRQKKQQCVANRKKMYVVDESNSLCITNETHFKRLVQRCLIRKKPSHACLLTSSCPPQQLRHFWNILFQETPPNICKKKNRRLAHSSISPLKTEWNKVQAYTALHSTNLLQAENECMMMFYRTNLNLHFRLASLSKSLVSQN